MNQLNLTAKQRARWLVLLIVQSWGNLTLETEPTGEQIDALYENEDLADYIQDAADERRAYGVETGLPELDSRYYECEILAAKCPDGVWISWPHWTGGGKFGRPGEIDWIGHAAFVNCVETEVVSIRRTFTEALEEPA